MDKLRIDKWLWAARFFKTRTLAAEEVQRDRVLVNDTVVAQGEIVLVNDRYGIRLTRVVPSTERLKTL